MVAAGVTMGSAITDLVAALSGSKGMAGDDPVGASVGRAYDGAAGKVIQAMADARNGLCSIGDGVRVSAHNYAVANASSDVTGRAAGLPQPEVTGPLIAGAVPSAVGAGTGAPAGWGWVEPYIGMIWPTGDSAKLRTAAGAWTKAWVSFVATEVTSGGPAMAVIAGQQIPEGDAIVTALTEATKATTNVGRQCQTIATQLNSYADHVDQVHTAIVDLLSRICDPMTGIKEVWDLLTDEDEDEIKRIADDIKTVVDNFAHEAEALAGEIRNAMAAAAAAAKDMAHWADKEWDHFLQHVKVAMAPLGRALGGFNEHGQQVIHGLYDVSQIRAILDPIGYGKEVGGQVVGAAALVGLGPDGGPGWGESWLELGKEVTHWDEWSKDPAKALGESAFDILTLPIPGGPLSKLGKFGRGAADAMKKVVKKSGGPKSPLGERPGQPTPTQGKPGEPNPSEHPKSPGDGTPSDPKAPGAQGPAGQKPPGSETPPTGGKPAPGSADGPLPPSPTESKPPAVEKPATGEPPKSSTTPPTSPTPGDPTPPPHSHRAEPPPTHSPAAPGAHSAEPTRPNGPHTPASVPSNGPPPETAPAPHGGEPQDHQPQPSKPHVGDPPTPGDGGPPHEPGEHNAPHHGDGKDPHDGTPSEHPADGDNADHPYLSDMRPWHLAQLALAESPQQLMKDLIEHGCPPAIAESALNSPYAAMTTREILEKFWDPVHNTWDWPKSDGFADGHWQTADRFPPGLLVDRIGEISSQRGDFLGSAGDSYPQRGLAPGSSGDYNVLAGTGKPLPTGWELRYGEIAEAFGWPGRGDAVGSI
nr:glycohydrolase toxin TNT-related protein [Mycobacterium sp. E1319]